MRLITIDNGNTNPNVGIFHNGILREVVLLDRYIPEDKDFVLISNVGHALPIKASYDLKSKRSKTHFFEMKVNYTETLGDDRLIASYGVYQKIKKTECVLIIDCGTFMTCDLVTENGFEGGYIFPGIARFLKIYHDSARLPHLSHVDLFKRQESLPHSTEEAILHATEIFLKSSLLEVIRATSPLKIILTGGSANEIKNLLSSEVQFELDRHLIHSALLQIYETHLRPE